VKAVYYERYGSPDALTIREVKRPIPKAGEVLVKVHAAGINSWDWDMIRGKPWIVRAWGMTGPRYRIPGSDISGVVTEIGSAVSKFKIGDEVFGDLCECGWGGYAEFACAKETALARKPSSMSFEQAAAIPQAGLMALQSLNQSHIKEGQSLLMNGAGGGVGTFAIQLGRMMGLEITAVDVGPKLEALRQLGAHHTVDYNQTDFTRQGIKYDMIIDVVASRTAFSYRRALSKNGRLTIVGGNMSVVLGTLFTGAILSRKQGRKLGILAYRANDGLDSLSELFQQGQLTPVIDSVFSLEQTPEAFRHFAAGLFFGKVVISMDS